MANTTNTSQGYTYHADWIKIIVKCTFIKHQITYKLAVQVFKFNVHSSLHWFCSLLLLMSCTLTWQVNFFGSFTLTESNSDSVNISIGLFENQVLNYSIKFLMPLFLISAIFPSALPYILSIIVTNLNDFLLILHSN